VTDGEKMEGSCSTGQSPQRSVVPVEEEGRRRSSSVIGIAIRCGLDGPESFLIHADRPSDLPILLCNRYWVSFRAVGRAGVAFTTQLNLVKVKVKQSLYIPGQALRIPRA
jgi:hypothetical protein